MYARVRRTLGALRRDVSRIHRDWRHFVTGMAAEAAFVLLLAVLSLLSVQMIGWMGP